MDEREAYLFDLQGFLAVPEALAPDEVAELDGLFEARVAADVPAASSLEITRLHARLPSEDVSCRSKKIRSSARQPRPP